MPTIDERITALRTALAALDTQFNGEYTSPESIMLLQKTIQSFNITIKDWNTLITHVKALRSSVDVMYEIIPDLIETIEDTVEGLNADMDALREDLNNIVVEIVTDSTTVRTGTLTDKQFEILTTKPNAIIKYTYGGGNYTYFYKISQTYNAQWTFKSIPNAFTTSPYEIFTSTGVFIITSSKTWTLSYNNCYTYTKDKIDTLVSRASLVSIIGEASQALNGLMSSEDKRRLDVLYALLGEDSDSDTFVNTISEVLSIFDQYPEGAKILTELASKQNTLVSGTNIKTINNESLLGSGNIALVVSADLLASDSDIEDIMGA